MALFDIQADAIPAGFSIETNTTSLTIGYRKLSKQALVLLVLGIGLSLPQLGNLPALIQQLLNPEFIQSLSLAYPENLIWVGPLGQSLFTFAALAIAYSGFALLIGQQMIKLDKTLIWSYQSPLPLGRRKKVMLDQVEAVHWEELVSGVGIASFVSYPVYLSLKNGRHQALLSFNKESDARFAHALLSDALSQHEVRAA